MDWGALSLSLKLAAWTALLLVPLGMLIARQLAWRRFGARAWVEALVALPLVLPPTVLGYYLLSAFGGAAWLGGAYQALFGRPLAFSFQGLLLASMVFNLPFAVQPMQNAFENVDKNLIDAARTLGCSEWRNFLGVILPAGRRGVVTGAMLSFAHTVGEFGVVLMVGGSIPGKTKVASIAIYEKVEIARYGEAAIMAAALLAFSFVALSFVYYMNRKTSVPVFGR